MNVTRPIARTGYWFVKVEQGSRPDDDAVIVALPWLPGSDRVALGDIDPSSLKARFVLNGRRRLEIHVGPLGAVELDESDSQLKATQLFCDLELVQPNRRWLQITNGLPLGIGRRWWGRWIPVTTIERDPASRWTR